MFVKPNEKQEYFIYSKKHPEGEKSNRLEAKSYNVYISEGMFGVSLSFEEKKSKDKLIEMKGFPFSTITKTVLKSFSKETIEIHKEIGFMNKLGILLYGPPGTGKSSLIELICQKASSERDAVCIFITSLYKLEFLSKIVDAIREEDPARPIVIVLEEIDIIMQSSQRNDLLNFLDGYDSRENICVIATTNFIEKITTQFTERPSRFKMVVEINKAPAEIIRAIILDKIPKKYYDKVNIEELSYKMCEKGVTIDQVKNVIINVLCYNVSVDDAISMINTIEKPKILEEPI